MFIVEDDILSIGEKLFLNSDGNRLRYVKVCSRSDFIGLYL